MTALPLTLLVNLYWLAPFLDYMHTFWLGSLLDESPLIHNADTSFVNVLRGLGQWGIFRGDEMGPWYTWAHMYVGGPFALLLWLPPLLGFAAPLLRRRSIALVFFLVLAAISIPLVVGYYHGAAGNAVTSPVYDVLYRFMPGFQMFRSAYKWIWPYEFAVAGLLALTVDTMERRIVYAPAVVSIVLTVLFGPVIFFKENHAALPLPPWMDRMSALESRAPAGRIAYFPGQYLESYDWIDQSYMIENALSDRPVVAGYMSGAPAEATHIALARAFKLARLGDRSAAGIFATLGVSAFVQRDDHRGNMDFAFVGSTVPTSSTLARDIITRVLGAVPIATDGALHLYRAAREPAPLMSLAAQPTVDGGTATTVAANAALSSTAPILSVDGLSAMQRAQVLSAFPLHGGNPEIRDLTVTASLPQSASAECGASACTAFLRTGGATRAFVAIQRDYPSSIGESFEFPDFDFSRIGGTLGPSALRIDGRRIRPFGAPDAVWRDFGSVRLGPGVHTLEVQGATPTAHALVALVPQRVLASVRESIVRNARLAASYRSDFYAGSPVVTVSVPRTGTYRVRAAPVAQFGAAPTYGRIGPAVSVAAPHLPLAGYDDAELALIPLGGITAMPTALMPRAWYRLADTFAWSRGGPVAWMTFASPATLAVYCPCAAPVHARLRFHALGGDATQHIVASVDGRPAAQFTLPATQPLDEPGRLPARSGVPRMVTLDLTLKPGANAIALRGAPRAAYMVAPDLAVETDASSSSGSVSDAHMDERGVRIYRLGIASLPLGGVPHIVGSLSPASGTQAWGITAVASGRRRFVRLYPVQSDGTFELQPAESLPNDASDRGKRLVGAWIAVVSHHDGATREPALEAHIGWALPPSSQRIPAPGSLRITIDGRAASGPLALSAGRHLVRSAGGRAIGSIEVVQLPVRRSPAPVALSMVRPSPVDVRVRVPSTSKPSLLVFNESFHPEWVARVADSGDSLVHVHANGYANGWLVPPSTAPRTIVLHFGAQRTFDATAIVSLLAFPLCIGVALMKRPAW